MEVVGAAAAVADEARAVAAVAANETAVLRPEVGADAAGEVPRRKDL